MIKKAPFLKSNSQARPLASAAPKVGPFKQTGGPFTSWERGQFLAASASMSSLFRWRKNHPSTRSVSEYSPKLVAVTLRQEAEVGIDSCQGAIKVDLALDIQPLYSAKVAPHAERRRLL